MAARRRGPDDEPAALIVIDVQKAWDDPVWGPRNNPQAEARIAQLLAAWRQRTWPIIHIRHDSKTSGSPLRPGQPGNQIKPEVAPHDEEPVLSKHVNSAFIGTDLEERLHQAGIQRVVLTGLTTMHCVSTTARMAGNLGFDTTVVEDATAAFALPDGQGGTLDPQLVHRVALAELRGEFASILPVRALL